jgi:hypothetical protein
MKAENLFRGRKPKPLAHKGGGGAVLRQSGKGGPGHERAPRGRFHDTTDPYLRGSGSPYSSAYRPPSKKGR